MIFVQNKSNTKSVWMPRGRWALFPAARLPPDSQEMTSFDAGGAGGVVSMEGQEPTFITLQLDGLLPPTARLAPRFLEEGKALWFLCGSKWQSWLSYSNEK